MGLLEKLSALRESAKSQLDVLNSKGKTENALLLPFFNVLGYDAFNVREVEPGHVVESEGEARTVDYAVKVDGTPAMLFQCEEATTDLDAFDDDPLFQYFDASDASLLVLTNGLTYRFFADLGSEGIVDRRPFFEFDLLDYESEQLTYLKRLTKAAFDAQEALSAAFELKYTRLLQNYLVHQRESPDMHFVRFLAAQIHEGEVSEGVLDRFQPVVQKLLREFDLEKRTLRRQFTSQGDGAVRPEGTSHSEDRGPSEDPSQPDESRSSSTKEVGAEAQVEEVIPAQSENGEQEDTAVGNTEDDPGNEEPENVELEEGDSDGDESRGGSNIAKEFANRVVGDS